MSVMIDVKVERFAVPVILDEELMLALHNEGHFDGWKERNLTPTPTEIEGVLCSVVWHVYMAAKNGEAEAPCSPELSEVLTRKTIWPRHYEVTLH